MGGLMAVHSDCCEHHIICTHCGKAILAPNIDLHIAHCSRKLEKCKVCKEMVPKKHAKEHFLTTHAPVTCNLCDKTVERDNLALHKVENCPRRILTCKYCCYPLPALELLNHQEVCGNRTEHCHLCGRPVRLDDKTNHLSICHDTSNNFTATYRGSASAEREQGAQRRWQAHVPKRRVLFKFTVAGVVILLGSIYFQKRALNRQPK